MPVIDLLRHGETTLAGHLIGRTDPPLTDAGWEQVRGQVRGRAWKAVMSSPARRAAEPAAEFAANAGVPLQTDPRWWEMDFGDWDGKAFADLRADPPTRAALKVFYSSPEAASPPNGETWHAFTARLSDGLKELEDESLVVCHAGVIRAVLHVTCGLPLDIFWTVRVGYAARVRLNYGIGDDGAFWGELVELTQS